MFFNKFAIAKVFVITLRLLASLLIQQPVVVDLRDVDIYPLHHRHRFIANNMQKE